MCLLTFFPPFVVVPVGPVIIVKLSLFVSFAVSALSSNILLYTGNTNDELVPSTLNNWGKEPWYFTPLGASHSGVVVEL